MSHLDRSYSRSSQNHQRSSLPLNQSNSSNGHHSTSLNSNSQQHQHSRHAASPPLPSTSSHQSPFPFPPSTVHANPPPPLSLLSLGSSGPPPQQGPSVLQILAMGQERNHAADSIAHHPRIESLVKLGKESEATWLQIGATAETLGDLDRATASYESALRHNAYSVVALSQIAAICRSKEEFKKAAEYFGRVVDIAPESGDVWGALGHCYLMIDDLKKAYSSYQQALYYMSNPQEPKLWYGIGILYDRYGSLEHAEEAFSSVIRMDPTFEKANEIFFRLGIIYKQQRKSAQSLECFRYILQNPPRPLTEIDIWFQIGHVYEQQKDYLAAKESYERVLVENPSHAKVLQQLGGLYHRSRAPFYNPEVSVTILTKSLESDANDPFSWYLLGRAYMTTNNFGKAYEAYQQAVYRDGKNPAFWCSIGVLYYNINQFHDALDAYSRAIRIHPYLAEVWFNLGALYESCNDQMTDAIDAYQRTIQLDPSNSIVGTRLREIQNHQSTGAPLSPPPTPKDISPSSLSWNYATNAGGAPSHPSGLGVELSPALSRTAPGPGSPSASHRFDGALQNGMGGGRPRSTDPYRPDDRRRPSGGSASNHSPSASMDQSPPSLNQRQQPGASGHSLPQIKSHESGESAAASARHAPMSPQRHSDVATDNSYPPHKSLPAHFSQNSYARGSANDMDWERSHRGGAASISTLPRNNSSGGRIAPNQSQAPYRRSPPPLSRDSRDPRDSREPPHSAPRDYHPFNNNNAPPPPPPGFERHFASPTALAPSRPITEDRDSSRSSGPLPPATFSGPPSFPPYSHYPPPNPPYYDSVRRSDHPRSEREREIEEEDRRRSVASAAAASKVEGSPIRPASVTRAREEREGSAYSTGSNTPGTPITAAAIAKGRGGRATKPRTVAAVTTPARGTPTSRSRKSKDGTETSPQPTKRRGTKIDGAPASKRSRARVTTGTPTLEDASPTLSPNPATTSSNGPSREVDEDYDEGVDALMGLATAHEHNSPSSTSPSDSTSVPPSLSLDGPTGPVVPAVPKVEEEADDEEIDQLDDDDSPNPRKRSATSPIIETESKRSKTDTEVEKEVVVDKVEASSSEVPVVVEVVKESNGTEEKEVEDATVEPEVVKEVEVVAEVVKEVGKVIVEPESVAAEKEDKEEVDELEAA